MTRPTLDAYRATVRECVRTLVDGDPSEGATLDAVAAQADARREHLEAFARRVQQRADQYRPAVEEAMAWAVRTASP